jgi:hypothetical protein
MFEEKKYLVICWYFDKDGVERFKNVNPLDKLLTIEGAQKLSKKMGENFKNSKIDGFNRLGEEIITFERYNELSNRTEVDPIEEVLPGLSLITTIASENATFGDLINNHVKPKEETETDLTIEELIQSVFSE